MLCGQPHWNLSNSCRVLLVFNNFPQWMLASGVSFGHAFLMKLDGQKPFLEVQNSELCRSRFLQRNSKNGLSVPFFLQKRILYYIILNATASSRLALCKRLSCFVVFSRGRHCDWWEKEMILLLSLSMYCIV